MSTVLGKTSHLTILSINPVDILIIMLFCFAVTFSPWKHPNSFQLKNVSLYMVTGNDDR